MAGSFYAFQHREAFGLTKVGRFPRLKRFERPPGGAGHGSSTGTGSRFHIIPRAFWTCEGSYVRIC